MAERSFSKERRGPDAAAFFATEAAGLAWLRVPGGPAVPRVLEVGAGSITMERVDTAPATTAAAEQFGRELAALHAAGAPAFGTPPPGAPLDHGWIGDAPMSYSTQATFPAFWAEDRVLPMARLAARQGGLTPAELIEIERCCDALLEGGVDAGPPEPPARLHGDLWSGNVLWGADGGVWLIDPAAHGGHRESDLAMLALFGAPELRRMLAAYDEAAPLASGWRDRIPLHQLWPLLVHAALFSGGYGVQAVAAARQAART